MRGPQVAIDDLAHGGLHATILTNSKLGYQHSKDGRATQYPVTCTGLEIQASNTNLYDSKTKFGNVGRLCSRFAIPARQA